jgi:protein-disulfide isomerase
MNKMNKRMHLSMSHLHRVSITAILSLFMIIMVTSQLACASEEADDSVVNAPTNLLELDKTITVGQLSLSYPESWLADYIDEGSTFLYIGSNATFMNTFQDIGLTEAIDTPGSALAFASISSPPEQIMQGGNDTAAEYLLENILAMFLRRIQSESSTDIQLGDVKAFQNDYFDSAFYADIRVDERHAAVYQFIYEDYTILAVGVSNEGHDATLDAIMETFQPAPFNRTYNAIVEVCPANSINCYAPYLNAETHVTEDGFMSIGRNDAPFILAYFSDYTCPHCAEHYPTARALIDRYVTQHVIQLWQIPLLVNAGDQPRSPLLHYMAYCAAEQDAYWQMNEEFFEMQIFLRGFIPERQLLLNVAIDLGLEMEQLNNCLNREETPADYAFMSGRQLTNELGIDSLPVFAISTNGGATWEVLQGTSFDAVSTAIRVAEPDTPASLTPVPTSPSTPLSLAVSYAELPDGVETKYDGLQQTQTAQGYPMLGNPDAPVLVKAFSSYTCPACRTWHETIVERVLPFVENGEVRFVAVPFDRQSEDETAIVRASLCAMEQGMYFEMSSVLYHWQGLVSYSNDRAESAAAELGMDVDEFTDCLNSNRVNGLIAQARQDFIDRGFTEAPMVAVNGFTVEPSGVGVVSAIRAALELQGR